MDTRRKVRALLHATACATFAVLIATPSLANEQMMRRERSGGGTLRDVGTGLAIGVVTGIIINQLNKPGDPPGGGIFVVDKNYEPIPNSICGPDITDNV